MTLALIVLVFFLVVWLNDSTKKKLSKRKNRKKTITNIQLQDHLTQENFLKIIADLEKMDKVTPLVGETLLDALSFLYELYDIPDRRSQTEKDKQYHIYLDDIKTIQAESNEAIDHTLSTISERIWYGYWKTRAPILDRPELLIGIPCTTLVVDTIIYRYDFRGIPSEMYNSIPAKIIGDIQVLLTIKDLKAEGYNYSWDRKESDWQQLKFELNSHTEKKNKYPWLY